MVGEHRYSALINAIIILRVASRKACALLEERLMKSIRPPTQRYVVLSRLR